MLIRRACMSAKIISGTETAKVIREELKTEIEELKEEKQRKLHQRKRGDELPSGVLEMVKIYSTDLITQYLAKN